MDQLAIWLEGHPTAQTGLALAALALACVLALLLARRLVLPLLRALAARTRSAWDDALFDARVVRWATNLVPALVAHHGILAVPGLPPAAATVAQNVARAWMVLAATLAATALLDALHARYAQGERAKSRPIKGYVQIAKLLLAAVGVILGVAALANTSPWIFLSGLGAMTAVLLLVFKDTLLSLVAAVQLTSNDLVRVGDWIEMPQAGVDGEVTDIALHVVKVQNWDKTIATVPTYALISQSFRNWRGMSESGGRRIKRAVHIDIRSIGFLSEADLGRFARLRLLAPYLAAKRAEIAAWNAERGVADGDSNGRRLTNIGTFRAYIVAWLHAHPRIRQDMTFLVRQLPPGEHGLPLEIYVFTATTEWGEYEAIQSDVFDHLLAIMPEFGLRAFQFPTGGDLAPLARPLAAAGA